MTNFFKKNVKKAYENNFVQKTSVPKIAYENLQKNNTSGTKGVSWHKHVGKWQVSIQFQGVKYHLGYYDDIKKQKMYEKLPKKNYIKIFGNGILKISQMNTKKFARENKCYILRFKTFYFLLPCIIIK